MKNVGEITFVAAIGFLIFLIWMNRNEPAVAAAISPASNSPRAADATPTSSPGGMTIRPQFIYNFPAAPDLSQYRVTGPNVPKQPPVTPITPSPSPCDCGCSGNADLQNQITQTVQDFAKNLNTQLGTAYGTYLDKLQAAIPPEYQQFVNKQGMANAYANERSAVNAVATTGLKQTGFNAMGDLVRGGIQQGLISPTFAQNIPGLNQIDVTKNGTSNSLVKMRSM